MENCSETGEAVALKASGRKTKRKPDEYARNVAKRARYCGGVPTVACSHNLANVCQVAKLSGEDVAYINSVLYSTTDKVKQDATLLSYMDILPVKRRRPKVDNPGEQKTRELTVKYFVLTETREKIPVCKASFLSMFCVKKDRLSNIAKYWMQKGVPKPELRGGARNTEENAAKREAVRRHIQKFTCRASHYACCGAPGRQYLPADLNVKKMHEQFSRQNEEQISYGVYYSVFKYDFNLGFGPPAKDVCSACIKFQLKMKDPELSEKRSPSPEEIDIKEVKPPPLNLECIKEEPIDEDYCQILPTSVSSQDIKKEPDVAKEDLKISSVFSLTGDSKPTMATLAHMDLPASCSSCKNVPMDGETVYKRKGHQEIFCSSSCVLKFFQMKVITQRQDVLRASLDNEGALKDFCSQTCLSSFNYKSNVSSKIPVVPMASHSQCSVCSRYCISEKEIIQQGVVHKICSEPCFLRFCNTNKLSVCANCPSCSSSPFTLKMQDGNKTLCGDECLVQFKQKIQTPQPCAMCHISNPMSNMVENRSRDNVVEFFCSCSCVMGSKIQAVSASGASLNCDHCGKTSGPPVILPCQIPPSRTSAL